MGILPLSEALKATCLAGALFTPPSSFSSLCDIKQKFDILGIP